MKTDIIIVGSGAAGLYCALHLPKEKQVLIITKADVEESDSFLAQGGICVLRDEEDYDSYFEDTMRAGHYENNKESVDIMIRSSQGVIKELIHYGVDFERENGELSYTREGAHSRPRILFHEDITGKEITSKLLSQVRQLENVTILDHTTMVDLICSDNRCYGVVVQNKQKDIEFLYSDETVLASGGIGGLYTNSTNFSHLTGDALAIAMKHHIELEHIDYIQIHPTTLYSEKPGRRFLISESVRGEGALLYNANKERFVDELLPRDVVTKAIQKQMKLDQKPYVWLSMLPIPEKEIKGHFPNIYKRCLEEGIDVTKDFVPVVPAQHYFMGGIKVNSDSRTTMEHLYAIGETSCNGVHGANRLASNSLLESLVFAGRSAKRIALTYQQQNHHVLLPHDRMELQKQCIYWNSKKNQIPTVQAEYKTKILEEIEREKHHESNYNEIKCRSFVTTSVARGYH